MSKKNGKAKLQKPEISIPSALDPAEKTLKIKELIKLAKEQGYLTYGDLNEILPETSCPLKSLIRS